MDSSSAFATALLELVTAVGGSYAFYKLVGPFLYNECFAAADDDDLLLEAGLFPPVTTERSPLLNGTSPRPNSLRLAAQLYTGYLQGSPAASSSRSITTPSQTVSGASTPASTAPSTPASYASSSYFDLKHPPLYVKDVSVALERETKRRTSAEFARANSLAGINMTPAGWTEPGSLPPPRRPSLSRGFSGASTGTAASAFGPRQKSFSEDTSYLTAALICLLHCPDLNDFFLSEKYLDEDVQDKQHRAVIDAYAATAQFFWPPAAAEPVAIGKRQQPHQPQLDLSVFQALFRKSASSTSLPLSSSPTRPASPLMSGTQLSSSPSGTLVNNFSSSSSSSTSGAQTISHLLRSLHVALNEGEYTAEQPTYLREPFRMGKGSRQSDDDGFRKHVGFLRNMTLIQEDSIVRDLFEGLCCLNVRCEACEETVVSFESFLALPLPSPSNTTGRATRLSSLLKSYERPSAPSSASHYCAQCRSYQRHTETRKIWSLPSVLVFQLPTNTTPTASTNTAPQSSGSSTRTAASTGPLSQQRRMSMTAARSNSFSAPEVDYPVEGLNMAKFNGERTRPSPSASVASVHTGATSEYDLSSESGGSSDEEEEASDEELYDLFAVRECVPQRGGGGVKYRTYAKDLVEEGRVVWAAFDASTGFAREATVQEVVTPNADLLFYRRREI